MSETTDNPINRLFSRLWGMLETDANFLALVPSKNCIKYSDDTNRDPLKQSVQASDLPEVVLTCQGIDFNPHATSSTVSMSITFVYILNSGDYRFNAIMARLIWVWICQLGSWTNDLYSLKWNSRNFVKDVKPTLQIGETDPTIAKRNIKGWVTVARIEVACHFLKTDLTFAEGTVINWPAQVLQSSPQVTNG